LRDVLDAGWTLLAICAHVARGAALR